MTPHNGNPAALAACGVPVVSLAAGKIDPESNIAPQRLQELRPTEFVLAALRCASLRVKLIDHEIAMIGTALKGGLISPETAIEWTEEVAPGCLDTIAAEGIA